MSLPRPESGVHELRASSRKHQNSIQFMGMHMMEHDLPLELSAAGFDTAAADLRAKAHRHPRTAAVLRCPMESYMKISHTDVKPRQLGSHTWGSPDVGQLRTRPPRGHAQRCHKRTTTYPMLMMAPRFSIPHHRIATRATQSFTLVHSFSHYAFHQLHHPPLLGGPRARLTHRWSDRQPHWRN